MTLRWDAPELQVDSDSSRTARYRLLQSWYREEILHARPGVHTSRGPPDRPCGSLLHLDEVTARPGLNFLDPKVATYATSRTAEVQSHNGTLEEGRLRHNMLSSMPLCLNLFGMIREMPEARLPFVQQLFDRSRDQVHRTVQPDTVWVYRPTRRRPVPDTSRWFRLVHPEEPRSPDRIVHEPTLAQLSAGSRRRAVG